jgi:Family of unknown function (DUF6353)
MNFLKSMRWDFSRSMLILRKHSPHIFFATGVLGTGASTVMACRATLKLSDTLDKIHHDVQNVKDLKHIAHSKAEAYSNDQYARDLTYVYGKGAVSLTRLYGPSVIVGVASISLLTGSHVQMTRRNSALMAAYAAVQKAYDDYRDRIRGEVGEDKELDLHHAATMQIVDKEEIKVVDPNKFSPYAKFFDEYSQHWEKDPELNRLFVQCQQNYTNDLLHARGHVFLNEVYDLLGIPRTKAGAVVGWVIGKDGDNYVDFGMYETRSQNFINGAERSILLDFNVDGVIYDKLGE